MKRSFQSQTIATGLAIFSMFFGAGNLIYPLSVGLISGVNNLCAISGFMLTGVLLPLLALIAIILFNGDYYTFFNRLGKIPGAFFILFCMLIIGPLVAIPRIVTLSHIMVAPFIGNISLPLFTFLFLALTFLGTYRESRIISLLGNIISPLLLVSLIIIIAKGLFFRGEITHSISDSCLKLFWESIKIGYKTLDMIGAIFFSSIVITILKENLKDHSKKSLHKLARMGLKAGILGTSLLAIVYLGMSYLGAFHGTGLEHLNEGELFSALSFRVLGDRGAIIIALAVLLACYSTIVALTAVVSDYVQTTIFKGKISYIYALIIVLSVAAIISNFGLGKILTFSGPYIDMGYPALIMLVFCNVAYKLFGFKPVKLPVLITLLISCVLFFY
jgi:branched-chain amino acid:cation transporter, LIVCS family